MAFNPLDQGPEHIFLADNADQSAILYNRQGVQVAVHHQTSDGFDARVRLDSDRVGGHGFGYGKCGNFTGLLFKLLRGGELDKTIEKRKQSWDRKSFLLGHQITLT